ncbi:hypothetical protein FEM48_Zijuj01G0332000 [Ziziphus jujuba var. spinosa]|uniref:Thioredoxin-like fold domain-containing protein MRL7L, chloroplastic n=1 Tax=Ziziphus jujuba var. spinosa TaxID=714518 RepID=A0A978W6R3_ZIZJJ|nr:hypothetical protein FEM48_Zijuj01G0332000 [Ziziphus jujuba var. spinosa]
MALQHNMWLAAHLYPPPVKQKRLMLSNPFPFEIECYQNGRTSNIVISCVPPQGGNARTRSNQQGSGNGFDEEEDEPAHGTINDNDPYLMDAEERREWRRKIREVIDMNPDIEEEVDPDEKMKKMQKLLDKYPLVVEEEDPDWPEDADGWGFNLGQFFDKITIKNKPRKDDDDGNYDSDNEVVWQDDNYIRPIKDITAAGWEETVFKDISPLVIIVQNRYKRPKENERVRDELEKAVHIIWNCRLPSPRCVAVDAVVELDLVSALQVSVFPEVIFTKAGKILYREKAIRSADELSKIMAFFYYGAAKPECLKTIGDVQEAIPTVPLNIQP